MRKLYEQDIREILYGATLLGAGGDKFGTRLWWDVKTDKPAW